MSYLVDTNAWSELARPRPDPKVLAWFANAPIETLHVSVLTVGELRKGVELLAPGGKREKLRRWLEEEIPRTFEDRLLPIDLAVTERWGRLLASVGRPVPVVDSLIAATALHRNLRVVTRNEADFVAFAGLEVVNPWK